MQPKLELLDDEMVTRVIGEARLLLRETGVKVQSNEARALLAEAGAAVDEMREVVKIPDAVVDAVLATVPRTFALHDASAEPSVIYGAGRVHFDPGSSAVQVLDPQTLTHRAAVTSDLTRIVKIAESLPQIDAQSTAVVCDEVPKEVADLWRLYVVLTLSAKPIVTGSFGVDTLEIMLDMLAAMVGGREALAAQPRAVFDVCPSPPLIWSSFGAGNLIGLARAGVPAEMVSMPLAGAAGPVTLLGSITQHAADRVGRRPGDLRHAEGHDADGGGRDRHDRCVVLAGRPRARVADARIPRHQRREDRGRPSRTRERHLSRDRRARRRRHDLGGRHDGVHRLPEP
jgi:trimethylamine--corrinoid protein Co-methyltransferase